MRLLANTFKGRAVRPLEAGSSSEQRISTAARRRHKRPIGRPQGTVVQARLQRPGPQRRRTHSQSSITCVKKAFGSIYPGLRIRSIRTRVGLDLRWRISGSAMWAGRKTP